MSFTFLTILYNLNDGFSFKIVIGGEEYDASDVQFGLQYSLRLSSMFSSSREASFPSVPGFQGQG
jgi:hypothetical protein